MKITGGPDGDVAGNELRILHREFGDHARIVGIADGSGSARDPNGLDHVELLRLVEGSLPITSFDRSRLSPSGAVVGVDEPNGLRLRNGMHNEVIADAFIPAGGRPQTIHAGNWQAFSRDGKPSSRVIVEGANLFITPEARTELSLSERANERIAPTFQSRTWRGSSRALWRRGSCTAGVAFLGSLPEARLAELAVAYLEQEHETEALVAAVRASSMPDKERIAALLALGGTRAALQLS